MERGCALGTLMKSLTIEKTRGNNRTDSQLSIGKSCTESRNLLDLELLDTLSHGPMADMVMKTSSAE